MGCVLRTCSRTESKNTSTRAESEQTRNSSQPSEPSHSSSVVETEELYQSNSIPALTESQRRTIDGQRLDMIVTDVRESLVSLDLVSLDVPSSSRWQRFQLPRRAKTNYLSEDDAYLAFRRKRAARTPNALSLIKRHLFYRSFPLTIERKKSVEKRIKKQKLGPFEEQRFVFRGNIRNSGASSGSVNSRGATKSVQSLPPGAMRPGFHAGADTWM